MVISMIILVCIIVTVVSLIGTGVIKLNKHIDNRRSIKPIEPAKPKGPFDHLPVMLLALADDVSVPVENVIMLAEDYVVDPPNENPPRSWNDDMREARQRRQPRSWAEVDEIMSEAELWDRKVVL